MKKPENGLTLVEVLASVVILFIVMMISFTILSAATNTHQKQMNKNEELFQTSYLLKIITKDARKSTSFEKSNTNPATYKLQRFDDDTLPDTSFESVYTFDGNTVAREATVRDADTNAVLSREVNSFENLQAFHIEGCQSNCDDDEDSAYLTVSFQQGGKSSTTKIILRKEERR